MLMAPILWPCRVPPACLAPALLYTHGRETGPSTWSQLAPRQTSSQALCQGSQPDCHSLLPRPPWPLPHRAGCTMWPVRE